MTSLKTRVINIRDIMVSTVPDYRYCGRPGPFGNPFIIGVHGDRAMVIYLFYEWFHSDLDTAVRYRDWASRELKGKVLGCYCDPLACHCHIVAAFLNDDILED